MPAERLRLLSHEGVSACASSDARDRRGSPPGHLDCIGRAHSMSISDAEQRRRARARTADHDRHRLREVPASHATGEVATYIPELSKADPEAFGVCLVTADGRTFEAGDCDRPFTIQSISKPFTYGMALEEFGATKVFEHVGVEPSGDVFNSIELQNGSNRPFNPMINSGAITVTALLHSRYGEPDVRIPARSVQHHRRTSALARPCGLRIRTAHRPSQSGDRPPPAQLRPRA